MKKIEKMKLRTSKNRLHQTDARELKALIHEQAMLILSQMGYTTEVQNAIMLEISHDELGAIPVEVKFVIKALDYDIVTAGEEFTSKQVSEKDKKKDK